MKKKNGCKLERSNEALQHILSEDRIAYRQCLRKHSRQLFFAVLSPDFALLLKIACSFYKSVEIFLTATQRENAPRLVIHFNKIVPLVIKETL